MKRIGKIALFAFLLLSPLAAKAGDNPILDSLRFRYNAYSSWCTPEKVYLHYDRSCFTAGETIWFKGWVQEASRYSFLEPSNFLYAEVLDSRGDAVLRVKVKRTDSGFPGYIELPDNLETGNYILRAYTLWQLNNDYEYLFNDRIRIIGGKGQDVAAPAPPSDNLEIRFWPEGGRYFTGHRSTIGFKVVDEYGRSVDFVGMLVNDGGVEEGQVSTVHDGMGAFSFVPEPGRNYGLRDAFGRIHPLPATSEEGATLHLQVHSGHYTVNALGYGGGTASLLVRDASELRPLAQMDLDGRMSTYTMEKSSFSPGINHFLLVDSQGRILAERLFYIYDEEAPVCRLDADGTIFLSSPDGAPLSGNCSVSVVRGALKDWQQSDGITSYMGLSSELKGRINNPYYYFDPQIPQRERRAALDLLMMIQGWRYYDLDKITDLNGGKFRIRRVRELVQEIRGHIARWSSSDKMPKKFVFTFMIPKQNVLQSVNVEKGRFFIVDSLDFEENTEMLINIGTSRLGATYLPRWDGDPSAEPYLYKPAPGFAKSPVISVPVLSETSPYDTLKAAVVTAAYEEDDVLVFGKSYREDLVFYKDMSLVEYLSMKKAAFEYNGEYMYNRNRRRSSFAFAETTDDEFESPDFGDEDESGKVKLIVEGNEESWWAFDMLRLGDLNALSISTQPDPFFGGEGGVVYISVKPGGVRRSAERNPSLLFFMPLGYQVPRCFEPSRNDPGEFGPQFKLNTIWWSPDVVLTGGRAAIPLDGGAQEDSTRIIRIEGLSDDGRPFSHHCIL